MKVTKSIYFATSHQIVILRGKKKIFEKFKIHENPLLKKFKGAKKWKTKD
jgi:hypothetical protein